MSLKVSSRESYVSYNNKKREKARRLCHAYFYLRMSSQLKLKFWCDKKVIYNTVFLCFALNYEKL